MKMTKKILSILLSCLMLMSLLSVGVFAAEGDQNEPINANNKWFGYGVDCFLMNTTLDAGDADGIWYELTADKAGILQLEHSYSDVDYQITATVNGQEYLGYENGVYNMPIATLPVAVGDVISIHIIAQDTALGGTVYCNAKFITGANDQTQSVKLKGANIKVWVANGATVYFQDDSLQAVYAAKGLELASSATEGITVISNSKNYTDTDDDGIVELVLGGSAGGAGAPPVKPSFAIVNGSGADAWFVLNVTDTAHECVYDGDTDADCNSCGAIRDLTCSHEYTDDCDADCNLCGEGRVAPHYAHPCVSGCTVCGAETPVTEPHVDADGDDLCDICNSWSSCDNGKHLYINACDTNCYACEELTRPDAKCETDAEYPCQDGLCKHCCITEMPATGEHEYFYACDATCMNCGELTNPDAAHSLQHVDAVEATCQATGNVEYWTCEHCGYAWLDEACTIVTNRMNIIVPMANHEYMYPCDGWCVNCYEFTNPDAAHSMSYHEAVAATCDAPGNIAYWSCEHCGGCWDNENAMGMPLNRMMIIVPAGHTYDNDYDADCNLCGDVRVVEYPVITFGGNSIAETADGLSGLAFRFDVNKEYAKLALYEGTKYAADYNNCTVTPDSTGTYQLVKMGAVLSNNWGITRLDYVDGTNVIDIPAAKVVDVDGNPYFSVRIINIPETQYDTIVTCTPYFIYENAAGEKIVVYGEEELSSINNVLHNG